MASAGSSSAIMNKIWPGETPRLYVELRALNDSIYNKALSNLHKFTVGVLEYLAEVVQRTGSSILDTNRITYLEKSYKRDFEGFNLTLSVVHPIKSRTHEHHNQRAAKTHMSHADWTEQLLDVYTCLIIFKAVLVANKKPKDDWLVKVDMEKVMEILKHPDGPDKHPHRKVLHRHLLDELENGVVAHDPLARKELRNHIQAVVEPGSDTYEDIRNKAYWLSLGRDPEKELEAIGEWRN